MRACAEELLARKLPIHGLINNAGLAGCAARPRTASSSTFGTNHLGHYLFTRFLLDRFNGRAGSARIVNVSSKSHYQAKGIDWDAVRKPTKP